MSNRIAKLPPLCGRGETIMRMTKEAKNEFAAVRFGNVFVSNGSVIPLFKQQIRDGGLQPDVGIKIKYTGLWPGEKLFEEKLMTEERMEKTKNKLIHIGHPLAFDEQLFVRQMEQLREAANAGDENIRALVAEIVPMYKALQ